MNKDEAQRRIQEIEAAMVQPDFWNDSAKAQELIKEMKNLQAVAEGGSKYDGGGATLTILGGAGGTDAEDFAAILFRMYQSYAENKGWDVMVLHENANEHGGYRNITFDVLGKKVYGNLKYESGVHRLVRISPFNSNAKRHTAFAMVEVLPKIVGDEEIELKEDELDVQFSKSGGAGGQNVNKRETAVRVVHIPTNMSVSVSSERSQQANREQAMELLKAKLVAREEEKQEKEMRGHSVAATTSAEWGSQIRSYVLHPYKMVKDHRTGVEERDIDSVLEGDLDSFIDAMRSVE
ncbi:MAG: PCRF domain-containing protein [Patescibacteria group bacterium UBA2163]